MIHLTRMVLISGPVAVVLITTSLFGQDRGQEQDLSPIPHARGKIVVATPGPVLALAAAPTTDVVQEGAAADGTTTHRLRDVSKKVRHALALGQPDALAQWIANLSQKKKYRIGYTKLAERVLADGIAAQQIAKNDVQALSDSSLNAALVGLKDADITSIVNDRFASLTGFSVPKDKQVLLNHIKNQNAHAQRVLGPRPRAPLGLSPIRVPTKYDPVFNWTLPGYSASSTGIVTAVQDQSEYNNCKPGSCWAFATVGAFEAAYAKANGVLIGASEQYLLNCTQPILSQSTDPGLSAYPWNCLGGFWAFPMLSASEVPNPGLPLRVDLPFTGIPVACPSPIDQPYKALTWSYVTDQQSIPTNEQLKGALCDQGPLAVAIFGESAWINNEGEAINDFPTDPDNPIVNHAVVLVGWDDTVPVPGTVDTKGAWMIKNSWGTGYGISGSGFLYIAYNNNNLGYAASYVVPAPASN